MSQKPSVKRINDKLIRVYTDILRMEEEELRKSQFRDLGIKDAYDRCDRHSCDTEFKRCC